jgi:hypothetical protein
MADEEFARLRPRDLATVWGTALGQVIDLWRAAFTALMEAGSGERPIAAGQNAEFVVPLVGGRVPGLSVTQLIGESWGDVIDGGRVTFREMERLSGDRVRIECRVSEKVAPPATRGDIYRGEVVVEGSAPVAVAFDVGS